MELNSSSGRQVETFSFSGYDKHGMKCESSFAYISHLGTICTPNVGKINFEISTNRLCIDRELKDAEHTGSTKVVYFVPGLKCFGTVASETPYGNVKVSGVSETKEYDKITGAITVELPDDESPNMDELDSLVRRVLDVLSLAEGRFMRWNYRGIFIDRQLKSMVCYGSTTKTEPRFPLFTHLNLEPILHMAIERYSEALCEKTGINLAIEWFLMHPRYLEAQFLTGMTALEHLIHMFEKHNPRAKLLPTAVFRQVRNKLHVSLENVFQDLPSCAALPNAVNACNELLGKLNDLNRRSLRRNLYAFLKHYDVPVSDIENEIPRLIDLRNNVVHIGDFSESKLNQPLSFYIAVLRELLTRIILVVIGYEGEYRSYINGHRWIPLHKSGESLKIDNVLER
ncbi:hypothetical protein LLG95_04555 [bacterium]|nr:hypothetical protein [bacterium]